MINELENKLPPDEYVARAAGLAAVKLNAGYVFMNPAFISAVKYYQKEAFSIDEASDRIIHILKTGIK